ncbi:VOC family protein [Aquibacillus sp. 3ASR75-11]|uniref:VOC family protein n=1 Tax=Terrihalobacillus insolitus TaxID=2950438 RepID=A0A9X3WW44_9BACI|nr:VOC family protein [Terrihalobacillus insolitus]MDC3413137.1 VOC family protein [Terrihalobacillus insolitus]MDC3425191.1 VOC family protein [Terrihalobacillus insolitus]
MLAIDHIVIASNDPEKSAHHFANTYGLSTVSGGNHDSWGTYNHLCFLGNGCYLEWLGISNQEKATNADNPLIQQLSIHLNQRGEGVFQVALRTDSINSFIHHFRENDIPFQGPLDGSRKKPDGSILSWRMLFPSGQETLPFLIEWGEGSMPTSKETNNEFLSSVKIGVNDREKTGERFNQIYRLQDNHAEWKLTNSELLLTDKKNMEIKIGATIIQDF